MLPFDNKSEFQIILNMPEGSALERTAQAAREIAAAVRVEPEVTDYQIYAGVAAPFNFNGLVRHYFMRRGAHIADLQVNLVPRASARRRATTSPNASARASPPSPPNTARASPWPKSRPARRCCRRSWPKSTGRPSESRLALARKVIDIFHHTPGVVDTDWYIEADQPKVRFVIDKEKAALHGISAETISADPAHRRRRRSGGSAAPAAREGGRAHRGATAAGQPHHPRGLAGAARSSGDANALPEPGSTYRRSAAGAVARTRERRADHRRQEHLPQEPHAGDLRHRRRGRRGGKPGLCHPEDERSAASARYAAVRRQRCALENLQRHPAVHRRASRPSNGTANGTSPSRCSATSARPLPRCWC